MKKAGRIVTAVYERDNASNWLVELKEEPRVHSFGRTIERARANIIDAASLWFEMPGERLQINDDVRLPEELEDAVANANAMGRSSG